MLMISPNCNHYIVTLVDITLEAVFVVVLWLLLLHLWRIVLPVLLCLLALLALHLQLPLSALLHLFEYQLFSQHFVPDILQQLLAVQCVFPVQRYFVLCVLYCLFIFFSCLPLLQYE